jgi:hypothetical protein
VPGILLTDGSSMQASSSCNCAMHRLRTNQESPSGVALTSSVWLARRKARKVFSFARFWRVSSMARLKSAWVVKEAIWAEIVQSTFPGFRLCQAPVSGRQDIRYKLQPASGMNYAAH